MELSWCDVLVYLSIRAKEVKSKQLAAEVKANAKAWLCQWQRLENPWLSPLVGEALKNAKCPLDLEHVIRWPLNMQQLRKMKAVAFRKQTWIHVRDVCCVWLAFFCMLRCSELVSLWSDAIRIEKDRVGVWVEMSKTDQEGRGEWVWGVGKELVEVVQMYSQMRGPQPGPFIMKDKAYRDRSRVAKEKKKAGGLKIKKALGSSSSMWLPQLKNSGQTKTKALGKQEARLDKAKAGKEKDALRRSQEEWGLKKATVTWRLRQLLAEIGVPQEQLKCFAWHSCRSGGATEALRQGVSMAELKRQGRWKSDAVEVYLWLREQDAGKATAHFGRQLVDDPTLTDDALQMQHTVPVVPYDHRR